MDVIVRWNNDTVNDMKAPVSGLISELDKVIKTQVNDVYNMNNCSTKAIPIGKPYVKETHFTCLELR